MSENELELGPVDYLIVEWPSGKEPNGEGLKHLVSLPERGLIREQRAVPFHGPFEVVRLNSSSPRTPDDALELNDVEAAVRVEVRDRDPLYRPVLVPPDEG